MQYLQKQFLTNLWRTDLHTHQINVDGVKEDLDRLTIKGSIPYITDLWRMGTDKILGIRSQINDAFKTSVDDYYRDNNYKFFHARGWKVNDHTDSYFASNLNCKYIAITCITNACKIYFADNRKSGKVVIKDLVAGDLLIFPSYNLYRVDGKNYDCIGTKIHIANMNKFPSGTYNKFFDL